MFFRMLYDERLSQATYFIGCQRSNAAIVIDPLRDVEQYTALAAENDLRVTAVAETHIHADFVSGAREAADRLGVHVYVSGEGGPAWRSRWLMSRPGGGGYPHNELRHGDSFTVGHIRFDVMHTPGHTPEHICFAVTDEGGGATKPMGIVTGDFLFVGDLGRPDLLETAAGEAGAMRPAAAALRKSLGTLAGLPDFCQVWPGHGAGSACGKDLGAVPTSTLGYERNFNPLLRLGGDEPRFVDEVLTGQPEPPLYFARMKRVNRDGPALLSALPVPPKVGIAALRRVDPKRAAIVDTRPWEQFRAGHLPGSLSLPLLRSFCTDAGSLIGEGDPVHLIVPPSQAAEAIRCLHRVGVDEIETVTDAGEVELAPELVRTQEIDVATARRLIAEGGVRVLDVRRANEFSGGHIEGAVNIVHTRLAARMDEVPTGGPLLVNCKTGKRSARACAFLARHGVAAINLTGGYTAWEAAR